MTGPGPTVDLPSMKLRSPWLLPCAVLALAAAMAFTAALPTTASAGEREPVPVVRQWTGFQAPEDQGTRKVEPTVIWTVVGVAGVALAGGALYLFKRQIGAFPRNPDWVAPISVMPASENPEEESDFPPPPAEHH